MAIKRQIRISTWFDDLIMHSISSQWLRNIESILSVESWLDVILNLTSFNASNRSEKSLSLSFSISKHSDSKKPIGNSSALTAETRHIRKTPSSMLINLELVDSSRSTQVISKLCPLLRQCKWCLTIFPIAYLSFLASWLSYVSSNCIKWSSIHEVSWLPAVVVESLLISLKWLFIVLLNRISFCFYSVVVHQ